MATLSALAREYRVEAARVKLALKAVKEEMKILPVNGGATWAELEERSRILRQMYRGLQDTSRYLEHYYDATAREYGHSLNGMHISKER